jgi:hypothetical protein
MVQSGEAVGLDKEGYIRARTPLNKGRGNPKTDGNDP